MLTLPDFQQKQILFIKTENGFSNKIKFHNDNIVFLKDDKIKNRASCHKIFSVFIIGNISITSELIKQGLKYGLSFFLLDNNFKCFASIGSKNTGNYLLKMKQYSATEEFDLIVSKKIVLNKIENQLKLLRSKGKSTNINEKKIKDSIKSVKDLGVLRGIEGNISKEFFNIYFRDINWFARMPRVKPDAPNFLLDMGYTFIFNFIDSLLNLFGFDTYKGFYHKLFFQRKSLTCDIIEPFRCLIDKEVLKIFNLKIFKEQDFKVKDGRVTINYKDSSKYAKQFFEAIMRHKKEIYNYIRGFYHFLMDNKKYKFPYFSAPR